MIDPISKIAWDRLETIEENCTCPEHHWDRRGWSCCGKCPSCECNPQEQESE